MVAPSDVPRRRNGMSVPYSMPQIASWLFLAATAIQFVLFITPIVPLVASVSLTVGFFLLVGGVFYFGTRAIVIDSMDVYLKKALNEQRNGEIIKGESKFANWLYATYNGTPDTIKGERPPENEETKQCWICDLQVADHSMHCKYCNKCVSHFDHHCLWLNTCIGEKNYRDFYRVMWAISVMQIVHLCISAVLVTDIFINGPTMDRADHWFGAPACVAVLLLFIVFDMTSLILLAQLIAFHIHLQKEKITTYQFIVKDSQKRREKSKLMMELHQQRAAELRRAKQEGQSCYIFRLKCGEKCRRWGCAALDPLEMPHPPPEPDPSAGFGASLGGAPIGSTDTDTPEQPEENGDGAHNISSASRAELDETGDLEEANNYSTLYSSKTNLPHENGGGVSFLPTNMINTSGGMSRERHDLDSLPSNSEAEQSGLFDDDQDYILNTSSAHEDESDLDQDDLLGVDDKQGNNEQQQQDHCTPPTKPTKEEPK